MDCRMEGTRKGWIDEVLKLFSIVPHPPFVWSFVWSCFYIFGSAILRGECFAMAFRDKRSSLLINVLFLSDFVFSYNPWYEKPDLTVFFFASLVYGQQLNYSLSLAELDHSRPGFL